jgi:hypothetical protein
VLESFNASKSLYDVSVGNKSTILSSESVAVVELATSCVLIDVEASHFGSRLFFSTDHRFQT